MYTRFVRADFMVLLNETSRVDFHPKGVAKSRMDAAEADHSPDRAVNYGKPWLYLGHLFGFHLGEALTPSSQQTLRPEDAKPWMHKFVASLNKKHYLGDEIVSHMRDMSGAVRDRIYKELGNIGWDFDRLHVVTIPELSWEPSHAQEERLANALKDETLQGLALGLHRSGGETYSSLQEVALAAITDGSFRMNEKDVSSLLKTDDAQHGELRRVMGFVPSLRGEKNIPPELSFADIVSLVRHVPNEKWFKDSSALRLLRFIAEVSPYSYLDIRGLPADGSFDSKTLPGRSILSAAARSDYFMLAADPSDAEAVRVIDRFQKDSVGQYWGRRPLLDVMQQPRHRDTQSLPTLEDLLMEGRARYAAIELKTQQFINKVDKGRVVPIAETGLRLEHAGDIAHTLWAMDQYLLHGIHATHGDEDSDLGAAIRRLRTFHDQTTVEERTAVLLSANKHIFKSLIAPPNAAMVVGVRLPYFSWRRYNDARPPVAQWNIDTSSRGGIASSLSMMGPHTVQIHRFTPRAVFALVAEYGRNLVAKSQGKYDEEPSLPHTRKMWYGAWNARKRK